MNACVELVELSTSEKVKNRYSIDDENFFVPPLGMYCMIISYLPLYHLLFKRRIFTLLHLFLIYAVLKDIVARYMLLHVIIFCLFLFSKKSLTLHIFCLR